MRKGMVGITLAMLAAPLLMGQRDAPEATIYRDMNYRGPAMAIHQANPRLRLAWPVTSIRVARGRWQLCGEENYRSPCIVIDQDNPNLTGRFGRTNRVASMRPMPGGAPTDPGSPGPSLRGMAAEFFPEPMRYGQRVAACQRGSATSACAARTADDFCRELGWTGAARQALETVNQRVMLADVLCTRTGN